MEYSLDHTPFAFCRTVLSAPTNVMMKFKSCITFIKQSSHLFCERLQNVEQTLGYDTLGSKFSFIVFSTASTPHVLFKTAKQNSRGGGGGGGRGYPRIKRTEVVVRNFDKNL